jgi:hypothetical protein
MYDEVINCNVRALCIEPNTFSLKKGLIYTVYKIFRRGDEWFYSIRGVNGGSNSYYAYRFKILVVIKE